MTPQEHFRLWQEDLIFCEMMQGLDFSQTWLRIADWRLRRYGNDPAGRRRDWSKK